MKYIKMFFIMHAIVHGATIYTSFNEQIFEVPYSSGPIITVQDMQAVRGNVIQSILEYENEKLSRSIASTQRLKGIVQAFNNHVSDIKDKKIDFTDVKARSEIQKCNDYIIKKSLRTTALVQEPGDFSDYFYQQNRSNFTAYYGSIELENILINKQKNEKNAVPQLLPLAHEYLKNKHRLKVTTLAYESEKSQAVQKIVTVGAFIGSLYALSRFSDTK